MVIKPETLEKIREIISKYHKYLLVTMIGQNHVPKELIDELRRADLNPENTKSFLEMVYNHNFLNDHGAAEAPKTHREMHVQQHPAMLPSTEHTKSSVDFLTQNLKSLIEKQRADVTSRLDALVQDQNNRLKFDLMKQTDKSQQMQDMLKTVSKNQLKTRLRDISGDSSRNWDRIVVTEVSNAVSLGSTDRIVEQNKGKDPDEIYVYRIIVNDSATCFPEDVKVRMWGGDLKPIGQLAPGDKLLNVCRTTQRGATSRNTVTKVNKKLSEIFEYTFEDGTTLKCTEDHPILVRYKFKHSAQVMFMPIGWLEGSLIPFTVVKTSDISTGEKYQLSRVPRFIKNAGFNDKFYYWKNKKREIEQRLRNGEALNKIAGNASNAAQISVWLKLCGISPSSFPKNSVKNNRFNSNYMQKISNETSRKLEHWSSNICERSYDISMRAHAKLLGVSHEKLLKYLIDKFPHIHESFVSEGRRRAVTKMRSNPANIEKLKRGVYKYLLGTPSKTSKPQRHLFESLLKFFPNAVLEAKLLDRMRVDILVNNVVVEYDGSGHHLFGRDNDYARDALLRGAGYAVIRVLSPRDTQPPLDILIDAIKGALPGSYREVRCD